MPFERLMRFLFPPRSPTVTHVPTPETWAILVIDMAHQLQVYRCDHDQLSDGGCECQTCRVTETLLNHPLIPLAATTHTREVQRQ